MRYVIRSTPTALDRRGFLRLGAGAAALTLLPRVPRAHARGPRFASDPFSLGVASGEPTSSSVVLWTRLAPDPLAPDGGLAPAPIPVRWQVARDGRFSRVMREGIETARPSGAHSVHADVRGLEPGADYHYRFLAGDAISPVGRTRTLPRAARSATLAFACCQRFEHGYFTAFRDIARGPDLDLVVHVGDYIYENFLDGDVRAAAVPGALRTPSIDLQSYRLRHALYKTDADLQAAHAAAPWAMILDNHDAVEDDHRDDATLRRRAAAYQAYYEHMPMRRTSKPHGPDMRIYHRLAFGDLLALHLLDTRQFKDDQSACPPTQQPNIGPTCDAALVAGRSMLGDHQERWLVRGLERSPARFNAITQTILFAPFDFTPGGPQPTAYLSGWDGYPAERQRILDAIDDIAPANPVLVSGDWHTAWVNDLHADATDPDSDVLASELVVTAASSDPGFTNARFAAAVAGNPDVRFYDPTNGYTRVHVDSERLRADFVTVDAKHRDGGVTKVTGWAIEDGVPIAQPA